LGLKARDCCLLASVQIILHYHDSTKHYKKSGSMESQLTQAKNHFASYNICYRLMMYEIVIEKQLMNFIWKSTSPLMTRISFFMVEIKISP